MKNYNTPIPLVLEVYVFGEWRAKGFYHSKEEAIAGANYWRKVWHDAAIRIVVAKPIVWEYVP